MLKDASLGPHPSNPLPVLPRPCPRPTRPHPTRPGPQASQLQQQVAEEAQEVLAGRAATKRLTVLEPVGARGSRGVAGWRGRVREKERAGWRLLGGGDWAPAGEG